MPGIDSTSLVELAGVSVTRGGEDPPPLTVPLLRLSTPSGGTILDVSGDDTYGVSVGVGHAANQSASRFYVEEVSAYSRRQMHSITYVNSGGTPAEPGDVAAHRTVFQQVDGFSNGYAHEVKAFRLAPAGDAGIKGVEIGVQNNVPMSNPINVVGLSVVNQGTSWGIPNPLRGGNAIQVGHDDQGWEYGYRYYGTGAEGLVDLFWVSGRASGARQAGEVMGRGRIYSTQGDPNIRVGVGVSHAAPSGNEVLAGMYYDPYQKALQIGAASIADSFRPVLLAPYAGNVAVGEADVTALRATFHVAGTMAATAAYYGKNSPSIAAPPAGYSALYPGPDGQWRWKSSSGAEGDLAGATASALGTSAPLYVASTAALPLTTYPQGVPGAAITLDRPGTWLVTGHLAMQWDGVGDDNVIIVGSLALSGGVATSSGAPLIGCSSPPDIRHASQTWVVTVSAAPTTVHLTAQKNAGSGTSSIYPGATTLTASHVGAG